MDYIPINEKEKQEMLAAIGISNVSELFSVIPPEKRLEKLSLPNGMSEQKLVATATAVSNKNASLDTYRCFCGAGVYDHFVPSLINDIVSRTEFLTAYTPYQPEASQGILQAIFEYQSLICELTGLDVANASLYDGASAVAEAAMLAIRATGRNKIIVSSLVHPEYRQVLATYLQGLAIEIVTVNQENGVTSIAELNKAISSDTAAVVIQNPNFFGTIEDLSALQAATKAQGALFITVVNPISLGILQSPKEAGADIAVGEGQALGNATGLGGCSFGFLAAKKEYSWKMPGRIVGQTVDTKGRRGFVLTLQSREQHIRREKATSNICTNAALNALCGCIYLSGWGPDGLRQLAQTNMAKARYAYEQLSSISGFLPVFPNTFFFNEFVLRTTKPIKKIQKKLLAEHIVGPFELGRFYKDYSDCLLFCVTEKRTKEEIDTLVAILKEL
jgi:glycine dehydrogenase subunit 1